MPSPFALALCWPLIQAAPTARALVDGPMAVPATAANEAPGRAPEPASEASAMGDAEATPKLTRFSFKPGRGFELATADGRYALTIRARVQVRYDLEHPNAPGRPVEHLIQVRRARLQLAGNVFGQHNHYYVQFGFSPRDMLRGLPDDSPALRYVPVRDARLEFTYLRDFTIWLGQMKVPFSQQRVISSGNLQLVDRSLANEEFNLDRDVGVQVRSEDLAGVGRLKYALGVFLGDGRNAFELTRTGAMYVGRLAVLPLGRFDDESEGDLERLKRPGLALAGAYAYHDDAPGDRGVHGARPADGGTTDMHHMTADVLFKWRGLSIESAFHLRKARRRNPGGALDEDGLPIPVASPRDGVGWFGQVGYLLPPVDVELVARYSFSRNIYGDRSAMADRDELGGGGNYYFAGHNLKLQLEYFRVWDEAIADGVDRLRVQVQLAF